MVLDTLTIPFGHEFIISYCTESIVLYGSISFITFQYEDFKKLNVENETFINLEMF